MVMNKNNIEEIIKIWVLENYGEAELNNPSWCIKDLARFLSVGIENS